VFTAPHGPPVGLAGPLSGGVAIFISSHSQAEYAVADFEPGDTGADRDDLAGNIRTEDGRVFDPAVVDAAVDLDVSGRRC
jgi:hypothetical protein